MKDQATTPFSRDFTLVVIGQIISLFGNAILRFALPLYLLRETGSSTLFGAVNASSFVPMIVFSLVGGVLADRLNKRNIMVILDFGTAGLINRLLPAPWEGAHRPADDRLPDAAVRHLRRLPAGGAGQHPGADGT